MKHYKIGKKGRGYGGLPWIKYLEFYGKLRYCKHTHNNKLLKNEYQYLTGKYKVELSVESYIFKSYLPTIQMATVVIEYAMNYWM